MKVLFFGNHDVGIAALESLLASTDVVGVVAHPPDPEEGVRFASVFDFAVQHKLNVIRGRGKDQRVIEFVETLNPDLIWVTDYRYILPRELIEMALNGAVNLHPSLLPKYRGRAPINWAILNGETEIGLTAHFIEEGVDNGDIIEQIRIPLSIHEDVGDALSALMPLYRSLTSKVTSYFEHKHIPRQHQDILKGSIYPARKPEDGQIDWSKPAVEIRNLVRAVAKPYPGAFCYYNGEKVYIWKAALEQKHNLSGFEVGELIQLLDDNKFIVQCGEGCLQVEEWSGSCRLAEHLSVGDRLMLR